LAKTVLVYSMEEVIGDGLIKLPFVAALRAVFPDARITWVAAKGSTVYRTALKDAVAGLIDEVIADGVTGARAADLLLLKRPFGGRRFDVVIDTQTHVLRSLVAKRAAGLFISPAADFRFSDRKPAAWPEGMIDRLMTLLSLAAGREIGFAPARLSQPDKVAAAERLLPAGPAYVGFAPSAGGAQKRWPLDRYIALAKGQADAGRVPVFFLTKAETEAVAAVRAAVPGALFPEIDNDLEEGVAGPLLVVAMGGRLAAAVANDAGPGHMLAAGGAPLLSLQLNRRKAAKFPPAAVRLEMLVAEDFGDGGMAAIPVAAAAAALDRLLERRKTASVLIPVSAGELIDKITILRVKAVRIDPAKRPNVAKELALLETAAQDLSKTSGIEGLAAELEAVNARLWDIEEGKRDCERRSDFGPGFVDLARAVYIENDRRAALKRRINEAAGSELIEEKSYRPY
jgi:ADP-heptose:LPS heptosyltransferase